MTNKKVSVWMIIWKHPDGYWVPWDFVRACRKRADLFGALRACRGKYPADTFKLQKFEATP